MKTSLRVTVLPNDLHVWIAVLPSGDLADQDGMRIIDILAVFAAALYVSRAIIRCLLIIKQQFDVPHHPKTLCTKHIIRGEYAQSVTPLLIACSR